MTCYFFYCRRNVSDDTIRRRLYAVGFKARRPKRGLILTARHRQGRLNWATRHLRFTRRQWGQVLFSDECKVNVNRLDGRVRVWRARGERVADQCVQRYDRWGGGSVHIWAGISQFGRTNLVILNGNVNANRYINDVLQPEVIPYMRQNLRGGIFQQDNARPHTANLTTNFLGNNNVNVLDWPSLSPDLAPIENIWAQLKSRVYARQPPPNNVQQLQQALVQEWNNIPQINIANVIGSMRRRCVACIQANGGYTRY